MLVRRQRDLMVVMHVCEGSILKRDGVNDAAWERLRL
jgi:hypothetical protein